MSTVTVPQVNPNDEVTALSVNQGPNAIAAVVNGNIDDANVSTLSGSKITSGTLPASASDVASNPETRENETIGNMVASGLIWSTLTGLNGAMSSGVAYVNGKRLVVSAVATYAFTASRDTYIYVDNTGTIQYNPQTNGATQPATPANNQLIAKVITSGAAITAISDLRVLGISSSSKSYTPTWSNLTLGNATVVATYTQVGKNVAVKVVFTYGSTTSITGSVGVSLPVNGVSTNFLPLGLVTIVDSGTTTYNGTITNQSSTLANILVNNSAGTYEQTAVLSSTVPMTWTAGDMLIMQFNYEAAA